VRILVLRRQAGFNEDNIRIFVETRTGQREIKLNEARSYSPGGTEGQTAGLSDASVRYLKAALAIIEIDLNRNTGPVASQTQPGPIAPAMISGGERMARVGPLIVSAFIGNLSFPPPHPPLRHADWTSAGRGWARGPVWYIMTNNEYRDFRHL